MREVEVNETGGEGRTSAISALDLNRLYVDARRFAAVAGDLDMDPDDLVQDAMEKLVAHSPAVDSPRAYLYTCIRNRVIELRRRNATRRRRMQSIDLALPTTTLDHYGVEMHGLLEALSPSDRALLYLALVEGWSSDQLALFTETSTIAVRKRLSRARRRFERAHRTNRKEGGSNATS